MADLIVYLKDIVVHHTLVFKRALICPIPINPWSHVKKIGQCHTECRCKNFVRSAHFLIGVFFLATQSGRCMRLLTPVYSMSQDGDGKVMCSN